MHYLPLPAPARACCCVYRVRVRRGEGPLRQTSVPYRVPPPNSEHPSLTHHRRRRTFRRVEDRRDSTQRLDEHLSIPVLSSHFHSSRAASGCCDDTALHSSSHPFQPSWSRVEEGANHGRPSTLVTAPGNSPCTYPQVLVHCASRVLLSPRESRTITRILVLLTFLTFAALSSTGTRHLPFLPYRC